MCCKQNHVNSIFLDSCNVKDTDFPGSDLAGNPRRGITDAKACQLLCQNDNSCEYWTFGLTVYNNNCWLKSSSFNPKTGSKSFKGLVSGRKFCGKLIRWNFF